MAWFAVAQSDRVDLWCSEDPCVDPIGKHEEPTMLVANQCQEIRDGATKYTVRPMTWVESQRWDGETPANTIDGIIKLALVAIDDDETLAKAAKKRLHPKLAVPLTVAIQQVTWGNFS